VAAARVTALAQRHGTGMGRRGRRSVACALNGGVTGNPDGRDGDEQ